MKKRYITTAVGLLGAGVIASYLLNDKEKKNMLKTKSNNYKGKVSRESDYEHYSTLEEAGIPDQLDRLDLAQIENAKMVSEGSQYGVNYYNEKQEEENNNID